MSSLQQALSLGKDSCLAAHCAGTVSTINGVFGPSVDDQAVSLSDDGTTIIIDFLVRVSMIRRLAYQSMVPL